MEWKHLTAVLGEYGEFLKNALTLNLLSDGSNASGTLANSLEYLVESDNGNFSVSIRLEDYWKYLNDGRGPGKFPPPDKIKQWITVKPVVPEVRNGRVPTVEELTFLISRKIAREGTQGTHFFDRAVEDTNAQYLLKIELAVSEDLEEEISSLLLELQTL